MPEPGGPGGPLAPQYLSDQLTLFEPGRADYPHLSLLAPPIFFTFRHHWMYIFFSFFFLFVSKQKKKNTANCSLCPGQLSKCAWTFFNVWSYRRSYWTATRSQMIAMLSFVNAMWGQGQGARANLGCCPHCCAWVLVTPTAQINGQEMINVQKQFFVKGDADRVTVGF